MKRIKYKIIKRIEVRRKNPPISAEDIYRKGKKITHFRVIKYEGSLFDVHNIRYDGKLYFVVLANDKIKECVLVSEK